MGEGCIFDPNREEGPFIDSQGVYIDTEAKEKKEIL